MRYRVKSPEGELVYASFLEVEKAYLDGLVGPEDEVMEEGAQKWRRAKTIPNLVHARRRGNQVWGGTQMIWVMVAAVFGSVALRLMLKGHPIYGLVLGFAVGSLLTTVTYRAFKRTKPS